MMPKKIFSSTSRFVAVFPGRSRMMVLLLALLVATVSRSQDTLPGERAAGFAVKGLEISLLKKDAYFEKGDLISNVLRVVNTGNEAIRFQLDISIPNAWKLLTKGGREYEVNAGDSLFLPLRIIPSAIARGNTRYLITVFMFDASSGKQLGTVFFTALSNKNTHWELTPGPREAIYFRNGENAARFTAQLHNTGNQDQDILFSFSSIGRNVLLLDSAGNKLSRNFTDISLKPQQDTLLHYQFTFFDAARNHKRVDVENYRPRSSQDPQSFWLYLRSQEPRQYADASVFQANKRMRFIRLSDQHKVHPYGGSVLPVSAELNVNNILGRQPFAGLYLRGNTTLADSANLVYFAQLNYTSYFYNRDLFESGAYYLGYLHRRWDVQVGNIGSGNFFGLPSTGKGVTGSYAINNRHRVGALISRSPGIFSARGITTAGIFHTMTLKNQQTVNSFYGHMSNHYARYERDAFGARTAFKLHPKHTLAVGTTVTHNYFYPTLAPSYRKWGFLANVGYGGMFLKDQLSQNIRLSYYSRNFGSGNNTQFLLFNRTGYRMNKQWEVMLQNNFNMYEGPYRENNQLLYIFNNTFFNELFFMRGVRQGRITPSVFYNTSNIYHFRLHSRGLGFNYNTFNIERNFRVGTTARAAYNNLIDHPEFKEYFTFQLFTLVQYRSLSLNTRYVYGPQGLTNIDQVLVREHYPQLINVSFSHQYMFRNERFVWQNSANYTYHNQLYSHFIGYYPEVYYFTATGWRFKLNFGYSVSSSNMKRAAIYQYNRIPREEDDLSAQVTSSFTMGAGIKKDFGIPLPKKLARNRYVNVECQAFIDANSNGTREPGEEPLENVVIAFNGYEALSHAGGTVQFVNLPRGTYRFTVFPLGELDGWFPKIPDSISLDETTGKLPVPFVKGVKIYGNVVLSKSKEAADRDEAEDLSRIRVTATDSSGRYYHTLTGQDGAFVVFVPVGNYTLTMDEKVMGERYVLIQNNLSVEAVEGVESIFYSFYIVERTRKVNIKKFGQGNE